MVAEEYDFMVLDLDGTLVGTEPSYVLDLMGRVGDRLGYEFSPGEAEAVWHAYDGDPDRRLRELGIDPEHFWTAFHDEEDPLERAEATFLYEDAERFAATEEPLALVTHCQAYLADPVLEHVDICDWFETVVCCTSETGWKPDPTPVESAMRQMGVAHNGHRGALAGDGPHDVGAAWNAGIDAIHVERHGHENRGLCVLGDLRIESFDEL